MIRAKIVQETKVFWYPCGAKNTTFFNSFELQCLEKL